MQAHKHRVVNKFRPVSVFCTSLCLPGTFASIIWTVHIGPLSHLLASVQMYFTCRIIWHWCSVASRVSFMSFRSGTFFCPIYTQHNRLLSTSVIQHKEQRLESVCQSVLVSVYVCMLLYTVTHSYIYLTQTNNTWSATYIRHISSNTFRQRKCFVFVIICNQSGSRPCTYLYGNASSVKLAVIW